MGSAASVAQSLESATVEDISQELKKLDAKDLEKIKQALSSPPEEDAWYFAIASMMNPTSLAERKLTPSKSIAAELIDYELAFFGSQGMAEARQAPGKSFHGVLHKLCAEQMAALDKMETNVTRQAAKAKLYNGELVDCTVYAADEAKKKDVGQAGEDKPPPQRYVEIMIEGAEHFGVAPEYISKLKAQEVVPRKPASEFATFAVPDGTPTWAMEDVAKGDADEGRPFYTHLNGKVLEYTGETDKGIGAMLKKFYAGKDMTLPLAKAKYDPKYGVAADYASMSAEHRSAQEDQMASSPPAKDFKVVGLVP